MPLKRAWMRTDIAVYDLVVELASYDHITLAALLRDQVGTPVLALATGQDETSLSYVLAELSADQERALRTAAGGIVSAAGADWRAAILSSPRVWRARWVFEVDGSIAATQVPVAATDLTEDELPQA